MTSPDMSVKESHDLIHGIENRIREETHQNTEVIVHIEPFNDITKPQKKID
jgi:divalent metal cation (Fe/Co/Zn/Cd) transporter